MVIACGVNVRWKNCEKGVQEYAERKMACWGGGGGGNIVKLILKFLEKNWVYLS
jgi:hypothetical protein